MFYNMMYQFSDYVGIVGVILLLTAFYLLNINKLSAQSVKYQILNLSAAVLILFSLMFHWNTASVLIEIAWITISSVGIIRIYRKRNLQSSDSGNVYKLNARRKLDVGKL